MKQITALFLCLFLLFFSGCAKKKQEEIDESDDLMYINYISEYTTGTISCTSTITLRLANNADLNNRDIALENKEAAPGIFKLRPAVKGKAMWDDPRTIVFYPDEKLSPGTRYSGVVALSKIMEVPEKLSSFSFSFTVKKQDFDVEIDDILFAEGTVTMQTITGVVETADWAEIDNVERIITAKGKDKELSPQWEHDLGENKHTFRIENIEREKETYVVRIEWDGNVIGINKKGNTTVDIYGLEVFTYLTYQVVMDEQRRLDLQFSMPLDEKQKLAGIIVVEGDDYPTFVIEKNIVNLYPSRGAKNTLGITINKELKDITGSRLNEKIELSVTFKQEPPQTRWVRKKGAILPGTEGFIVPFEAISLKAVDVSVIEVYEDNIIQFLQVNRDVTGTRELKRVGRPVLYKTISLDHREIKDLYEWNRFNLDFSDLFKLEPGSLYQVRINFRRSQSIYSCADDVGIIADEMYKENWDMQQERSYWDYYENYYEEGNYWENRNNPCKNAYYGTRRQISTNILTSDLGIIAKGSENGRLHVFVTDIKNTNTIGGVDIDVYNYQQQIIATGKTNSDGYAFIQVKDTDSIPFAIIARYGKERGYLRVDDGTSLSLSNFDVGGSSAGKGIKGFIYGERGVWRPGDTIYLTFILEDKEKVLPANHPVICELINPKSQVEERMVKTENTAGIYTFRTKTDPDDPTGNWKAMIRVGGEVFSKTIKIETIKPNRLKINLDFGKEKLSAADKQVKGTIESTWLHGAPAKHLRAEFDLILNPMYTSFNGYPGFSFDDPSREYYPERKTIFDDRLSSEGRASFSFQLGTIKNAPGAFKAIFTGKVYEEGGDFSIDKLTIPYYPYTCFTGVKLPPGDKTRGMLLTDEDHKVQIVTVDPGGNPLSRKGLEVSVYKISWKWWWDHSDENLSSYLSRSYSERVSYGKVDTRNGKGEWNLRINYPAWGRYFIRVFDPGSGHAAGKIFYIDWPGWAGSAQKGELGGATMLSFYSDKNEYTVGEKAAVTIPGSADGRALVGLETGSRLVDKFWIKTKKGETSFHFDITSRMSPTVYIHVTLVQPHAQVSNDLPVRLYGVVPVKVVDPATKLAPEISIADTLAPEKEVSIVIKEKSGKPMAYTVAVVDEGLLDITNFDTPRPWNSFYTKEALGVKTWDMYDEVIGILSDHFGPLLAAGGGGEELIPPKDQKAQRFKPVVKFFGPFYLDQGQRKEHNFIMPRYIGSVKTMVVAAYEGAYGSADAASFVKESVMVLGTMPRVLGPGEKIKLPVSVFVLEDNIRRGDVTVKTEGPLTITGTSSKSISFADTGEKFVYFDLETPEEIGIAKVFITAEWGQEKTTYNVELDVRPSNPLETDVSQAIIKPGEEWVKEITPVGLAGTNKMSLELTYLPPVDLEKNLSFLIRFPHGCIEQTTSAVFPQVYLDDIVTLTPEQQEEIENNIKAGIDKLKTFRTTSGGFGYWPGDSHPTEWGSSYAGHFLLEAKNKGYSVPPGMLSSWANYQESIANKWDNSHNYYTDMNQAYRLYTLALYGKPNLGAMNRLKEKKNLDLRVRWRLAAAYALAGKKSIAEEVINSYKLGTAVDEYPVSSATYGSALRDKAMILETLVLLENREMGYTLLKEIAARMSSGAWHSTQTTAYALVAMAKFGSRQASGEEISCDYTFGNEKGTLQGSKSFITTELPIQSAELRLKNKKNKPVYLRLISQGIPLQGEEKEEEKVISMKVTYTLKDGTVIKDLSRFTRGTDIYIETEISNSGIYGNLEELALTQIVPSGWEILNLRLQEIEDFSGFSTPDYQDIRDDRVHTYFDIASGETKKFRIMVNTAYLGEYYMPGINCEAMYNNEVTAKKKGRRIVIGE